MKFRSQKAMRSASWKWLSIEGNEFLFDLSRDARERANLAAQQPGTCGAEKALRGLGGFGSADPGRRESVTHRRARGPARPS